MKYFLLIILITILGVPRVILSGDELFKENLNRIMKTVEDLKAFCIHRKNDFCSKEQMKMNSFILEEKINHIKREYEREQEKLRKEEQMRQHFRKN